MSLHRALLDWFEANRRDLPWRRSKDPYAIWVSEVMLQQTQVATVIPYFMRWMERFPNLASLRAATEEEVLAVWQGLGYYRRCRTLLAAAKGMQELPASAVEWMQVSGIGRYTAGAIASIAHNEAVPLVDGNVERVYSRLEGDASAGRELSKNAWQWATDTLDRKRPGDWNQALMELGATICRPQNPSCSLCPVRQHCRGHAKGMQASLPTPVSKPKTVRLSQWVWIPIMGGHVGVRKIPVDEWWAGMWEFPRASDLGALRRLFPQAQRTELGTIKHTVTHHRICLQVSMIELAEPVPDLTWLPLDGLERLAMPSPQRKAWHLARARLAAIAAGEPPAD